MLPKPLPSQLRIGVDTCHVSRIQKLIGRLSETAGFERWASKIFNSHEWPEFSLKTEQWRRKSNGIHGLEIFSKWLAGRWAAKEAAIKAHSNRGLLRLDISILSPTMGRTEDMRKTIKPLLLIDPPRRVVKMDYDTAKARGLREAILNQVMPTGASASGDGSLSGTSPLSCLEATDRDFICRRRRIEEEDRQLADLSISHDGEYAIAVCLALDEALERYLEPVMDGGTGEPIHEPEWGDHGFGEPSDGAAAKLLRGSCLGV